MTDSQPIADQDASSATRDRYHPELRTHVELSILLKNAKIDHAALQDAVVSWRSQYFEGGEATLIDLLIGAKLLPKGQKENLDLATEYALKRRRDKLFGKRAFHKGYVTKTQLDESLAFQKQLFKALREVKRIEDILQEDGFITAEQIAEIWEEHAEFEANRDTGGYAPPPASIWRAAHGLSVEVTVPEPPPVKLSGKDDADDDQSVSDFFDSITGEA